jgi:putative ABC transport system permease protein
LVVRGKALEPSVAEQEFGFRTASAGFFAAAGIPVVSGRVFGAWEGGREAHEAVISQRLAQILFAGENPIGHEIAERPRSTGASQEPKWFRIVGVVGAVPSLVANTEPSAELYVPWGATYWPNFVFVVRSNRPLADVSRFVRDQIRPLAPAQTLARVETLEARTAETRSAHRTAALLVGGFAIVALALSALGIFGLMAHETNRRTQEIGVRLALGAEPRRIAFDSVLRAVKLVAAGIALGLCGAGYASEFAKSLLFEVTPHDASSYVTAAGALFAAAILASLWPAVRAARIDPIRALRHE